MRKSLVVLVLALSASLAFGSSANPAPDADVLMADAPIMIDGVTDAAWAAASWNAMDDTIGGLDLTGQWKALWDADNLYLLIDVADHESAVDGPADWQDDSVEIYMDADLSRSAPMVGNDSQYTIARGNNTVTSGTNSGNWSGAIAAADISFAYRLEVAIPWVSQDWVANPGDIIGFGLAINDDDDGGERDDQIFWNPEGNGDIGMSWTDSSQFPEIRLVPEPMTLGLLGLGALGVLRRRRA